MGSCSTASPVPARRSIWRSSRRCSTAPWSSTLRRRMERSSDESRVHQHGWAHVNHEPNGRRSEFGAVTVHRRRAGRSATGAGGDECGLRAGIERGVRAAVEPLQRGDRGGPARRRRPSGVTRRHSRTVRRSPASPRSRSPSTGWPSAEAEGSVTAQERGQLLATASSDSRPVGVMLHHAVMTDDDLDHLDELPTCSTPTRRRPDLDDRVGP